MSAPSRTVTNFEISFALHFQSPPGPRIGLPPALVLPLNWPYGYPAQSLGYSTRGVVTAISRFASQNFLPSPQTKVSKRLIHTREAPSTLKICVTTPAQAAAKSRLPPAAFPVRSSTLSRPN